MVIKQGAGWWEKLKEGSGKMLDIGKVWTSLNSYTRQKMRDSTSDGLEEVLSLLAQIRAKISGIGEQVITLWGSTTKVNSVSDHKRGVA